jgi:hypothetical protein
MSSSGVHPPVVLTMLGEQLLSNATSTCCQELWVSPITHISIPAHTTYTHLRRPSSTLSKMRQWAW